jgi:hypothetical protein
LPPAEQKFTYVRYDTRFDLWSASARLPGLLRTAIDDLSLIPTLQQVERGDATLHVSAAHFVDI